MMVTNDVPDIMNLAGMCNETYTFEHKMCTQQSASKLPFFWIDPKYYKIDWP